jgi:predicted Mrr-cat superfamily restriction endonuclease
MPFEVTNSKKPMNRKPTIIYTRTDEAPPLATYSFLPIIKAFQKVGRTHSEMHFGKVRVKQVITLTESEKTKLYETEFLPGLSMSYLEKLANNQDLLHLLDGKTFEILIAGLQRLQGFEVRLTKASHDGYIDIVAVKEVLGEKIEIITQCKVTRSPQKNANINDVRAFFGVVCQTNANKGIFATLGRITSETRKFVASVCNKLQLFTKSDIVNTIKDAVSSFRAVVNNCYKLA